MLRDSLSNPWISNIPASKETYDALRELIRILEKDKTMEKFTTGAQRDSRMPRYDLIPKTFIQRTAERLTGKVIENENKGGALQYGECNWMKGLPTSDVISHIFDHLTNYSDEFRRALYLYGTNMQAIKMHMNHVAERDDELAGACAGIAFLMEQEKTGMFHDSKFSPDEVKTEKGQDIFDTVDDEKDPINKERMELRQLANKLEIENLELRKALDHYKNADSAKDKKNDNRPRSRR